MWASKGVSVRIACSGSPLPSWHLDRRSSALALGSGACSCTTRSLSANALAYSLSAMYAADRFRRRTSLVGSCARASVYTCTASRYLAFLNSSLPRCLASSAADMSRCVVQTQRLFFSSFEKLIYAHTYSHLRPIGGALWKEGRICSHVKYPSTPHYPRTSPLLCPHG